MLNNTSLGVAPKGRAGRRRHCVVAAGGKRLRGGELGHGLGALRDGVLGELAREREAHGGLDLAARERLLLVVARQGGGLRADALEHVVDERVHDGHAALGDAGVRVDLLEDLVDVGRVALDAALLAAAPGLLLALGAWRTFPSSTESWPF